MKEDPGNSQPRAAPAEQKSAPRPTREPDAIYQRDKLVGRVLEPEVHLEAKEIRFGEIYNSDSLLLPDECEYQNYNIVIQRITFAAKVEPGALHKGRVLRGVVADILGYREQ